MKYCPKCETRFDEEVIRFCTVDGTPLIEEAEPRFTELPSESFVKGEEDDPGEVTVIRRKDDASVPPLPPDLDEGLPSVKPVSERIVIDTAEAPREQNVRPRTIPPYYPPPQPPPSTLKIVVLTVFGTIALLGLGALLFWFLQKGAPANANANTNLNANQNTNLNTNVGFDSNFNFNAVPSASTPDVNLNTNVNMQIKTPTPTPKPSPSPTATPEPTPERTAAPTPEVSPTPRFTNIAPRTPAPTPRQGPRPTANPSPER